MNGADPYSALHQQQQLAGAGGAAGAAASPPTQTPGAAAAAAAEQRAAAAAGASVVDPPQCEAGGFPILDKHAKPLVGSDTAEAVRSLIVYSAGVRAMRNVFHESTRMRSKYGKHGAGSS